MNYPVTTADPANTIAFQGDLGAYSHLACLQAMPDFEPLPCLNFQTAFAAVSQGQAALGMIPIENSLAGRVADIHHLMPYSGLFIIGEHFQPVHHNLLAIPGATLDDIKTVSSHPQGLAQCRVIIRELGITAIVASDTAGAAKDLAASPGARIVLATHGASPPSKLPRTHSGAPSDWWFRKACAKSDHRVPKRVPKILYWGEKSLCDGYFAQFWGREKRSATCGCTPLAAASATSLGLSRGEERNCGIKGLQGTEM